MVGQVQPFSQHRKLLSSSLVITQPVTNSCLICLAACAPVLEPVLRNTTFKLQMMSPLLIIWYTTLPLKTDFGNVKTPAETPQIVNFTPILLCLSISPERIMIISTAFFGHLVTLFTFQVKVFFQQLIRQYLCTGLVPKTAPTMIRNVQFEVTVRVMRYQLYLHCVHCLKENRSLNILIKGTITLAQEVRKGRSKKAGAWSEQECRGTTARFDAQLYYSRGSESVS